MQASTRFELLGGTIAMYMQGVLPDGHAGAPKYCVTPACTAAMSSRQSSTGKKKPAPRAHDELVAT
jgi:hypothetical protein